MLFIEGIKFIARDFFSFKQAFKRSFNKYNLNPVHGITSLMSNISVKYFYEHEKLDI